MCVSERKRGILCLVTNGKHSSGEDCGKYHIIYWWFGCCVTSTMGGPLWTATLGKRQVSGRGEKSWSAQPIVDAAHRQMLIIITVITKK